MMNDKSALLWLTKNTEKYRFSIALLTVLELLISLMGVLYALVMKQMVDRAVMGDSHGFVTGITGFAMLVAGQITLRIISRQLSEYVRSSIENTLKKKLLLALFQKEYQKIDEVHSGEWMNRMTSDTAVCAGGITDILPGFMGMSVRLAGSLILIFYLQPALAAIIVPGGLIFLIITMILRSPLKRFHKEVQEQDGRVRVYLQEHISSMLVVRAFGKEKDAVMGADECMTGHRRARMHKVLVSNICNSGFSLAVNSMYLLGIAFCGYGIIAGNISYGTLIAIIQLIGQLQSPLSGLSGYIPRYYAMTASAERLMEVESYSNVDTSHMLSGKEIRQQYEANVSKFVFENVSFSYDRSETPVLDKASFSIDKGDYVAITGSSGCGKTTMLKIFMGIYEPSDGTAGVVLKDGSIISMSHMRHMSAYVPQGNLLMCGTVRNVITFGVQQAACKDMSREEIDRLDNAIHLACADFVYELPQKLDTLLGEKGAGLSEGQMQRLAIARALYADCPVLIMDEATSALDARTETELLDNLRKLKDKTILLVTHRPKALEICNKELVFENGCVREKKHENTDGQNNV